MSTLSLEERVALLEVKVQQLEAELNKSSAKDWRKTIGMFTDNPGVQAVFDEALKLREQDRARARRRFAKKKRAKRKRKV